MEEESKMAFYVAGLVLVVFALGVSALGIRRSETFATSTGSRGAVIAVCALLVALAMATAVITG
jgi:hypothetical protein